MSTLVNLVVELDTTATLPPVPQVEISEPAPADDRVLAWIDDEFSPTWSSEAAAGATLVARHVTTPIGFVTIAARGLKFRWLAGLGKEQDVGLFGPFGVAVHQRKSGLGEALLRVALAALAQRGYARALIPAVSGDSLIRYYVDAVGARVAERFDRAALLAPPPRTLVMASGNGSNLQAVLDASAEGTLPIEIAALICNNPGALAIERARRADVPIVSVLSWDRGRESRAQYDGRLLEAARACEPNLVLLLGWMHLLGASFVEAFPDLLNLHPAYLPLDPDQDSVVMPDGTRITAFRGPRAVRDALASASRWMGATVHRVTRATDRGPVLARKPLRVEPGEEEATLMERVHGVEQKLVPAAVTRWLFERPADDRKENRQ
ncbi:MAG TPA: formyltransferase family protein [Candidatus Cybelea sp.]